MSELSLTAKTLGASDLLGGKYRLERLLGEGGMGQVWLARNELLDLPVALKILRRDALHEDMAARLLLEARVEAKLQHPNVVRVFDCGSTASGEPYIVMELLEGISLGALLATRGALSPLDAVQLLLPVIDGLCAAHRAGVVHRDLKPDNIFIVRGEHHPVPKILDFGIAKLNDRAARHLTATGQVLGSPAYMSPEQARGSLDIDSRADIWAMCVVLYETVTGQPAFDGDNYNAVLRAVIECEPVAPQLPGCDELWPIVRRGLLKRRTERCASMEELGAALAQWLLARGVNEDVSGQSLAPRWVTASRSALQPSDANHERSAELLRRIGVQSNGLRRNVSLYARHADVRVTHARPVERELNSHEVRSVSALHHNAAFARTDIAHHGVLAPVHGRDGGSARASEARSVRPAESQHSGAGLRVPEDALELEPAYRRDQDQTVRPSRSVGERPGSATGRGRRAGLHRRVFARRKSDHRAHTALHRLQRIAALAFALGLLLAGVKLLHAHYASEVKVPTEHVVQPLPPPASSPGSQRARGPAPEAHASAERGDLREPSPHQLLKQWWREATDPRRD
jgi:serine/threonine protein kinase